MPFYEYQCKSCGHELEAMQKVSDPPLKKCPDCGKSQLQRLMSAPVFRLKGGGWYETDFKGDQDNKRNLADRPDAEASKEVDSSSADAKTEPKPGETQAETKTADAKPSESGSSEAVKPKATAAPKAPVKTGTGSKPAAKKAAPKRASRPARKPPAKAKRRR